MSGRTTYDVSREQMEMIKWKDARRRAMRQKYQSYVYNPVLKGEIFDPAIQRWETTKVCYDRIFRPNWRNFGFAIATTILPMYIAYTVLKYDRDHREKLYSTGQVAYKDRDYKFT